ncbi:PREDICTED: uncharacterized protein LOC109147314 [Ipomoea nil]|uniref:uncharacterized protein LOC109147314 n=1 Tax=Ipomoea nil TaxID=35883 RepID=UPI0009010D22|nr:PREDICTED: uncharacterized protein LOC109147314 [Ipomoea nil]
MWAKERNIEKGKAPSIVLDIQKPSLDAATEAELKELRDAMQLSKIKDELDQLHRNDPEANTSYVPQPEPIPNPSDIDDNDKDDENDQDDSRQSNDDDDDDDNDDAMITDQNLGTNESNPKE